MLPFPSHRSVLGNGEAYSQLGALNGYITSITNLLKIELLFPVLKFIFEIYFSLVVHKKLNFLPHDTFYGMT